MSDYIEHFNVEGLFLKPETSKEALYEGLLAFYNSLDEWERRWISKPTPDMDIERLAWCFGLSYSHSEGWGQNGHNIRPVPFKAIGHLLTPGDWFILSESGTFYEGNTYASPAPPESL